MSETEANWKKLRRSSTSYEKAKIECLATKAGSKTEQEIQHQEHCYNNLTAVVTELTMRAVIYKYFTWWERIWVHPEWWFLFSLAFIWPSFCNSKCYCQYSHFCFHRSVSSEFWTRTCWYCQPLLNWKQVKIAIVINLVCRGVHCYWEDVIIPPKISAVLTFWGK